MELNVENGVTSIYSDDVSMYCIEGKEQVHPGNDSDSHSKLSRSSYPSQVSFLRNKWLESYFQFLFVTKMAKLMIYLQRTS